MRTTLLLALMLCSTAFVGCIGSGGEDLEQADDPLDERSETFTPAAPERSFVDAMDPNHPDHHLPELHTAGHGLNQVGYQNFQGFYPPEYQGGWGEVDVHDGRDLAAVGSVDGPLGITLVDISDPTDPQPLSYITAMGGEFDARFSEDGQYLFFGCQVSAPLLGAGRTVVGDCKGSMDPHAPDTEAGHVTVAYDVSDPENPELAGAVPTNAAHNVWTRTIGGTYYAFTNAVEIISFDPSKPVEESMEIVANVQGTHDVYVHQHPVTGDWLLYTGATEDSSFAIYNINDPSNPQVLLNGGFPDVVAWHEQTVSDTLIDGRVILIGAGETFTHTGAAGEQTRQKAHIVDVTDPTDPKPLSTWELPISTMTPWANYRFSAHNIDMTPHGQVSMAWYHAGIWVFDISTQERQEEPVTLGFFQPHELWSPMAPPTFAQIDPLMVPLVWGGMWTDEGRLVLGDLYTGVYVLEPEWGLLPGAGEEAGNTTELAS